MAATAGRRAAAAGTHTEVGTWIAGGLLLLGVLAALVGARRRAERRAAEARARARARRNRVPLVSANLRGQSAQKPDIWRDEAQDGAREERVA
jgi:hypothetical protein